MNTLNVRFRYCYGIKNLEYSFDFRNKNTYVIYAPNGMMKTSFAKTFKDFAEGNETKDLVFPERKTIRDILSDPPIEPENVFVIEPYRDDYQSDKMSTLLVNKKLRNEYESIHKDLEATKNILIKKLKQLAGLGRNIDIDEILKDIFGKDLYNFLIENEKFISEKEKLPFNYVQYSKIFNDKVLKFLNTKDFKEAIKNYIEKYNELIDRSPYLRKEFSLYHAENVYTHLTNNNFFKVGHSINLSNGQLKKEVSDSDELKTIIKEEKNKVLEDEELQKRFNEIDRKLNANRELREFRDYLRENREILPELSDLDSFERKIWLAYFIEQKALSLDLVKKYKDAQNKIKDLVEKAREEHTDWEKVINIFNRRFVHLPFYLKVENKEDVILKDEVPVIMFVFKEGEDERVFKDKFELLRVLSTGEKRALYILNIIFEVEARKKKDLRTLFIIDDIADSFDYKNKYAIIEYLLNMSEENNFYLIILTHNFDFFRTVKSRLGIKWSNCLITLKKSNGDIVLKSISGENIINPFKGWIDHLTEERKLIALIPFVRNIIEYTQGTDNGDYSSLTSILHYKENTENIKLDHLKPIFEHHIQNITFPDNNLDKKVIDLIFETAENCLSDPEGINLEDKIILSMAIRLKAEKFMVNKLGYESLENITSNQTQKLFKKYTTTFENESEYIDVLQRVVLMTPENIHLNSFMYEPLIDMGVWELRELYKDVKEVLK